jgi:hypothetical protein
VITNAGVCFLRNEVLSRDGGNEFVKIQPNNRMTEMRKILMINLRFRWEFVLKKCEKIFVY